MMCFSQCRWRILRNQVTSLVVLCARASHVSKPGIHCWLGMLKSFFFLKIDYRLLKIDFSRLSFPDVKVTVGCSNILGCCTVRSDEAAAVKAGGGEAGLQRRRLNRPALHIASNSHLLSREMKLCRLVNRPSMNRIHLYPAERPASLSHTTPVSQSAQRMWWGRARG